MDTIKNTSVVSRFKTINFSKLWLIVLSTITVLGIGLATIQTINVDKKISLVTSTTAQLVQEVPELDLSQLNEETIIAQQLTALDAIVLQTDEEAISGEIIKRPDFVSPIEWLIVKGVAKNHQDSDIALIRLVNHLRFAKQEEAWEELLDSADTHKRHALANKLLSGIPLMVADNNLSLGQAQRLQISLLGDLVNDSEERMRRLAEEAKRIGVTFEIKTFPSS
jgi:hypothetical protein